MSEIAKARQAAQLFVDSYRAIAGLADVLKNAEAIEKRLDAQTKELAEMEADHASATKSLRTVRDDLSGLKARFDAELEAHTKEFDAKRAEMSIALVRARNESDAEVAKLDGDLALHRKNHAAVLANLARERLEADVALSDTRKALADILSRIG